MWLAESEWAPGIFQLPERPEAPKKKQKITKSIPAKKAKENRINEAECETAKNRI